MIKEIRKCWQAGLTLSATYRCLNTRHGFTDKAALIREWRDLKKKFGCGSMPISYLEGGRVRAPEPISQEELNTPVGPRMYGNGTYGNWKGITGPGKMLREMLRDR